MHSLTYHVGHETTREAIQKAILLWLMDIKI